MHSILLFITLEKLITLKLTKNKLFFFLIFNQILIIIYILSRQIAIEHK